MKITRQTGGKTASGETIFLFHLINDSGAYVALTNLGVTWVSAVMPAANGALEDVLLGYEDVQGYLSDPFYMGATIGRFANRIANATFFIGNEAYELERNEGAHTNHGGFSGFHKKVWQWEEIASGIRFTLHSPDREGGYPGNLFVSVDYQLDEENTLLIRHRGITDAPTCLNMTNHAYFNLNGSPTTGIAAHHLLIPATKIVETAPDFIPTGKFTKVGGTVFDFTFLHAIGDSLSAADERLIQNRGYNHCYVLKESVSPEMKPAARLVEPVSGRELVVETDLPGVLLYTAGYLEDSRIGKKGIPFALHTGICLETQFFPDAPNHPGFPSCRLNPGEVYDHQTRYCFRTVKD